MEMSFDKEKFKDNFEGFVIGVLRRFPHSSEKQVHNYTREIVSWACDLIEQCLSKDITITKTHIKSEQIKLVKQFVKTRLEFKPGAFATKDAVYNLFVALCEKSNVSYPPKNVFSKMLLQCMPEIRTAKRTIFGKKTYCWRDLQIKKA